MAMQALSYFRILTVLFCLAASAAAGCSSGPPLSGRPDSRADAQLAAFGRGHPQCQLWTDWQKMCSRTGPNGATDCVTDPDRPVRPSAPFCVHAGEGTMTRSSCDACWFDRLEAQDVRGKAPTLASSTSWN